MIKPRSIREVLEDKDLIGSLAGHVHPRTAEELTRIFEYGYTKIVLAGDIGWGKTTVANIITLKLLDELTSYTNIQEVLGLGAGEPVHIVNLVSNGLKTIQSGRTEQIVKDSPRLMSREPSFKNGEIRFQNGVNVVTGTADDAGCLGLNVVGAFLYADGKSFSDPAKTRMMVQSINRRITARFFGRGNKEVNTKSVVIGYSVYGGYPNSDFVREEIAACKDDPYSIVIEHGNRF